MSDLREISRSFAGVFGQRRRREPQTRTVSVFPDGHKWIWQFKAGSWWWRSDAGSFPYTMAKENAEAEGITVIREPIRRYWQ